MISSDEMKSVLITAGPAWEPVDAVRRLTNHSTGSLGGFLASELHQAGLNVMLLWGDSAPSQPPENVPRILFSHATSLREALEAESSSPTEYHAVLHLSAVSDFRLATLPTEGKRSSRTGPISLLLEPAPKLIRHLREWFPSARLVGWKYEVDGGLESAREAAENQLKETGTNACVLNGPAYGDGFGWIEPGHAEQAGIRETCRHLRDRLELRDYLIRYLRGCLKSG